MYVRIEAKQEKTLFFSDAPVMIPSGDNWYGEGETLELAIATAARDALRAIREEAAETQ